MTPSKLRMDVIADRVSWTRTMLENLKQLPLSDKADFLKTAHLSAAAESYLRRALEALLDLGRHLLAKGVGVAAIEYRDIATKLGEHGILDHEDAALMRDMAGYRNRMVHFYNEISADELFDICANQLNDVERILNAIVEWVDARN